MFDFTRIESYREGNRMEAKLATGGLPESIWETYSAFANSYGGVILLGVEELPDRRLRIQGLLDPQEMLEEFLSKVSDPKFASTNLLREEQTQILELEQGRVIVIEVPRAARGQRPVYVGSDPYSGTYRRIGDGDYHCTHAEVDAMLAGRQTP